MILRLIASSRNCVSCIDEPQRALRVEVHEQASKEARKEECISWHNRLRVIRKACIHDFHLSLAPNRVPMSTSVNM